MITVPALLAEAVSQALDKGVDAVHPIAARELLSAAGLWSHSARDSMVTIGPLKSIAAVTSEAVHARLLQLLAVRCAVTVPEDSDAATSLVVLLNVLLAEDAAIGVKHRYANAARAAMAAAVIADLRNDQEAVDAQRKALTRAAGDALSETTSGAEPDGVGPAASELARAELRSRLRGEIPTTAREASELKSVVCYLADVDPHDFTPLSQYRVDTGHPVDFLYEIHDAVLHRLGQLHTARRELIYDRPWPRFAPDIGELLAILLLTVLSADAAATVAKSYADAEARVVSLTAAAHLRGDAEGVAAQREVLRAAADAAIHQLGDPNAPVEPRMVEDLLHAQLA